MLNERFIQKFQNVFKVIKKKTIVFCVKLIKLRFVAYLENVKV